MAITPAAKRRRERIKQAVAEIRAATVCARCGKQPVEWHSDRHHEFPELRICNMTRRGRPVEAIKAEMALCEPVCRRCHINGDGRIARMLDARRSVPIMPPKPCKNCGRLAKVTRKGRCCRCRSYMRYHPGVERPIGKIKYAGVIE
jgi:hypothetical protein